MRFRVSMFVDASFCHETGAAGWGSWTKSERGIYRKGGPFKEPLGSATMAEKLGIANAIALAMYTPVMEEGDHLLIQTDNLSAVHWIMGKEGAGKGKVKDALDLIRAIADDNYLMLEARHVKGHQGTKDRRSAVNTFCDRVAKQHMKAMRAKLKGK